MADDSRLVDIASAVAEGSAIDWEAAAQTANDGSERAVVRELQVLARIADVVRTPQATLPIATTEPAEHLRVGEPWGHLRISEVIGEGSFGTVYRAWDRRLECEVALKLIKASGVSRAFDLARALKEARLLARVRHGNVVRVFGADSHRERFGLWMELIPGRTLEQVLVMQGQMGMSEVIPIGIDLCHALAAVHGAGLLHRDLKARNVLREEGGRIVLMDFGTGRDVGGTDTSDDLAGTPLYLAPELFAGAKPSAATDIYSLGVLLYHLVTGDYPVRGNTREDVESAHRTAKRQPLRDVRPDLSPAFIDVIERALAPDPRDRYQSAGQFGNALAAAAGSTYAQDDASSRSWRKWQISVAAGAVAALLAGLIMFGQRVADGRGAEASTEAMSNQPLPASTNERTAVPVNDSYEITASFYASRDGRDVKLSQGSRVRPGDKLFAVIDSSQPVFVYIINRDDAGQSFLLFPLPELDSANPLSARQKARLPGTMNGQQFYWHVTSVGGQEHFYLYVTPQRLAEFEQVMSALPRAELGRSVSNLPLSTAAIGVLRGVGGLSAVSSAPPSSAGTELAGVLPLGDDNESAEGVWARRISLQNPGE
jgi:serine/threonine protein kinase